MDKKLQLIRHLYGETDDREALRELLKDEDLNHEYQELSEAKFWLDHTHHERPDQAVLDNIFAAAAQKGAPPPASQPQTRLQQLQAKQQQPQPTAPARAVRQDRTPVARKRKNRRLYGSITAVFTLLIAVGIGYRFMAPQNAALNPALQSFSESSAAEPAAELNKSIAADEASRASGLAAAPQALRESESEPDLADADAASLRAASVSVADTSLPEWNEDLDEILRFQRRIDMLLEQNQDLAWDEAAIPLEALPSGRLVNPALRQAGSRQPSSGNQ